MGTNFQTLQLDQHMPKHVRILEGKSLAGLPRHFPQYRSFGIWFRFLGEIDPGFGPDSVIHYAIHFDTQHKGVNMKEVRVKKGYGTTGFASQVDPERVDLHCADDGQVVLEGDTGVVSDGYHTFDELYLHRNTLFIALMSHGTAWMSRMHSDGTMCPGMFVAGTDLPQTGFSRSPDAYKMVTYHMPDDMWDLCLKTCAEVLDRAPEHDGHDSNEVLNRLKAFIEFA